MKARWVAEAAGATLVLLFPTLARIVSPGDTFVYHHALPVGRLIDGLMLDGVVIGAGAGLVLALRQRIAERLRRVAGGFLAGVCLWAMAYCVLLLLSEWRGGDLSRLPEPSALSTLMVWWFRWSFKALLVLPAAVAAVAWIRPGLTQPLVRATRVVLAAAAFCWIWMLPTLLVLELGGREASAAAQVTRVAQPVGRQGRIVWILFDELSYKLAIGRPPVGETFPNFEKLRGESLSLGNVQPVGYYTDLVVPSLLDNRAVVGYRSTPEGRLLIEEKDRPGWRAYDEHETLFAAAQTEGWNPGVVGWAIPYCRLMGDVLTRCFADPGVLGELWFEPWARGDSILSWALAVPRGFLARLGSMQAVKTRRLELEGDDDAMLMKQSRAMLADPELRFIYIHLPVPHPPGVFDRRTRTRCACGNYLDNLAMADEVLGELRGEIDATGERTALIVSSDHSWRVPLWKGGADWTAEEERVSQGQFDPRPVFLVHFAGQTTGSEVEGAVPELVEHDVIAGMLAGKIRTPEDARALVAARAGQAGRQASR